MTANIHVHRTTPVDAHTAFALVEEYNQSVGVVVRDTEDSFLRDYFGDGSGVWLAEAAGQIAGCIALRPLADRDSAGEVKRLYVRPAWRGHGVADGLLQALEDYARACGYQWLYLDSKDDLVAALRFYARHGYIACERYNTNPQATVFMRKRLVTEPQGISVLPSQS